MNSVAFQVVVYLSFLFLIWYFIGSYLNQRQSHQIVRWIQGGLDSVGEGISVRWLSISGFQIVVEKPLPPFKGMALMVILEPRSMLLAWLFHRLMGRKGLLSIRGNLLREPDLEFEVFDPQNRIGKEALQTVIQENWISQELENTSFLLAFQQGSHQERLHRLSSIFQPWFSHLLRFSIRKNFPHLLASFSLSELKKKKAEDFFSFLKELGRLVQE
ncbi:MAG TPA: hypothetical protein VNM22_00980 [Candidatus Limnocylindrales bacterium]|nr:hypothetical protein [Candidatus Limnocylindrales bacterium]